MAITYPLTMPVTGFAAIEFASVNAVAYSVSPFTFKGQAQAWPGQMLRGSVSLPPMVRANAEAWVAFLLSLRGQFGTFLLGDPVGATPRGSAGGTPLVNGASQTGETLVLDGATVSQTGWLKAGDYIQLGAGATARLHKVLADANSDGSGNVSLDLWPHIATAPANNAAIVVNDTVGLFKLATNEQSWSINVAQHYGLSFNFAEAI
jgi:hypothetical protein